MSLKCPLCGEKSIVNGKCIKCGYLLPTADELELETSVYDLDPEDYPVNEKDIKNALPPLEKAKEYDYLPSFEIPDFVPNEVLGAEYEPLARKTTSPQAERQQYENADDYMKLINAKQIVLSKYRQEYDAECRKLGVRPDPAHLNDIRQKIYGRDQTGKSFKEYILHPDPDKGFFPSLLFSLLFPLVGLVIGIQLLRRANKPAGFIVGGICILLGLLIFICPGFYAMLYEP